MPRREVTQRVYSKDVKTLADDFNAFFASLGSNVSEASRSLATENDLSVLALTIALEGVVPVTLDEFFFQPVSCG